MAPGVLVPQRPETGFSVGGQTIEDQQTARQEMVIEALQRHEVLLTTDTHADHATSHNLLIVARQIQLV